MTGRCGSHRLNLTIHMGGGDDLGIHMPGNADDLVRIWGDAGNDQLLVQGGHGALYGGAGRDAIISYDDASYDIYGGAGGDQVYAHRGVIHDGAGDDDYSGNGSGLLLLDYGTATRGIVADLSQAADRTDLHRTDLHRIDARDGGRDNAFIFVGDANFAAAGQLRAFQQGGDTVIEGNTTGTGGAELRSVLTGVMLLEAGDFVL